MPAVKHKALDSFQHDMTRMSMPGFEPRPQRIPEELAGKHIIQ